MRARSEDTDGFAYDVTLDVRVVETLHEDLSAGANVAAAVPLRANAGLCFQGMNLVGKGFRLDANELAVLGLRPTSLPAVAAFLLGATEWAKPGGALGFIVHARFLFQEVTFTLRQRVFRRVRITGIMNFAALRQDKRLWPTNSAPFALIVGRNEAAKDEESFYFISPRHEPHLAEIGQFRVDPGAATPVPLNALLYPYAFKSIFKGGLLGLKLVGHIHSRCEHSIGEVLAARGLSFNAGFQVREAGQTTTGCATPPKPPAR